jgi:hypothetical protein
VKKLIATLVLLTALAVGPWLISAAYMDTAGIVANGNVVAKREAILMPGGDTAKHIFEITYEYQPRDANYRESVVQRVDEAFYRGRAVGSPVRVRYSPSRLLRSFAGMGLYLEDASPLSRLHYGPPDRRDLINTAVLTLALVMGLVAYRSKSKRLGGVAALLVGTCFPWVLLLACAVLVFPLLFWAARDSPGKGYGVALVAMIWLCAAVVYYRVPQPVTIPADQLRSGTAIVRQVRVVDELWSDAWETTARTSGEYIGPQFQMVELEFTPQGSREPIHALDRIDVNSVPGLRAGSAVAVEYSTSDPDAVRIVGATRHYARRLATHVLLFTYGAGALMTFVLMPLRRAMRKVARASAVLRSLTDPYRALDRMTQVSQWSSQLPEDDPRRKAIESAVAALRAARKPRDERK